jgi:hypothetical protein
MADNREFAIYFDGHCYRVKQGKGGKVIQKWSKPHNFENSYCEFMILQRERDNAVFVFAAGANYDWSGAKADEALENIMKWSERHISEYILQEFEG